ncbi:MAG: hypothetical protein LBQ83_05515 [Candidatus Margulisbacteria bacterium]|jgi:hypothetical protein|nr:hypothetical protein [Candidatus Margulisiibacteriota bacterium]
MFAKLISHRQTLKILKGYYPAQFQITNRKNSFCVSLNDSILPPSAYEPESSTGLDFTVYRNDLIFINHLHVMPARRGLGLANNILAPLWTFYFDFNFRSINLISINEPFWRHIARKFPWINFNITEH